MIELEQILQLNSGFRFQWEPAQDCYVLLYPEGMVRLNGSAGEILAQVDGQQSVADIIQTLSDKFPQVDDLDKDVIAFLEEAIGKNWLTIN